MATMKVLIVKMSSMGDLIHTLPALSDAGKAIPSIQFDWVVERGFTEIPRFHPRVNQVIPIALRSWRKNLSAATTREEWLNFYKTLRSQSYDLIIDPQGLLKSAAICLMARGKSAGYDFNSIWERAASFCYSKRYAVAKNEHVVQRIRKLFAQALNYTLDDEINFGIDLQKLPTAPLAETTPYVIFFHGTTWTSKEWPEVYWASLLDKITALGIKVALPWGNTAEHERAQRLAKASALAFVLPKMSLSELASFIAKAKAAVSVDTGLGHLSSALGTPTITLYGPTDALITGITGPNQIHLNVNFPCAPCSSTVCLYTQPSVVKPACYSTLSPERVFTELKPFIEN